MEKIKQFVESDGGKDILTIIIVVLVGLSCFELGRLSEENTGSGIKIEYPNQDGNQGANTILSQETLQTTAPIITDSVSPKNPSTINSTGKSYFASSRGSKYYSIGCSGGKSIKQENRVYFSTREEAQAAGYTLSGSCK